MDRISSEAQSVTRVTNSLLRCKDCIYRLDDSVILRNTSMCKLYYPLKPTQVLAGGDCFLYQKE